MSIHNTLFFRDCINYIPGRITRHGASVIINEMSDNNYKTFSTESDINVNMRDLAGNATRITHIFAKYTGVLDQFVGTPTGGSGTAFTRQVPTEVTNFEGTTVSLEVDGYKHDLYELQTPITATDVRLQFTGTNVQICALMLLDLGLEINANGDFSRILPHKNDRTGQIHEGTRGGVRYVPRIGAAREKWEYDLTLLSIDDPDPGIATYILYKAFLAWREVNRNCFFAREFTRFPDEVMPVTLPDRRTTIEPRSQRHKSVGDRVPFQVWER